MSLYAVGDIHGCEQELTDLFEMIVDDAADKEENTIVFLGDYIDRGPDSALVIEYLLKMREVFATRHQFVFLKGNHEDMLIKAVFEPNPSQDDLDMFYFNGGFATQRSYEENNLIFKDHKNFYDSLARWYRHGEFFFVHAGLAPTNDLDKALNSYSGGYDGLLWDREWNDHDGKFPQDLFVVHGHTPVPNVKFNKNQINIDTGCVFGKPWSEEYGQLTAVRLDGRTKEEIKVFQVRKKM